MHPKGKRATATHNKRKAHNAAETCATPSASLFLPEGKAVITRQELATLFGKNPHTIDYHKRQGRLVPVTIPGSSRSIGFTRASVLACFGEPIEKAKGVK